VRNARWCTEQAETISVVFGSIDCERACSPGNRKDPIAEPVQRRKRICKGTGTEKADKYGAAVMRRPFARSVIIQFVPRGAAGIVTGKVQSSSRVASRNEAAKIAKK
jgi:hypothetical protein